jgi:transcriptional regulator with XRE-family HTH domain
MNNFAKNLQFLRKKNSITQQQLADRLKKGNTTIGNWENGLSEPKIEELIILSNIFGISLQDLIETELGKIEPSGNKISANKRTVSPDNTLAEEEPAFGNPVLAELQKINNNIEELKVLVDKRLPSSNAKT